jgi:hypothetical protein
VIDEHAAFAAPTDDGGFCLHFASAQRSGPSGSYCLPGAGEDEIAVDVAIGHDGGFVFGRVGADGAATVEITVPYGGGTLTRPVAEEGFFLADLPPKAMQALDVDYMERIPAITATAKDVEGTVVARSAVGEWAPPDVPTETGPVPGG